jgi:hypothetical protein
VRAPSCADVAFLLLESLEEELQRLLPFCSGFHWEDEGSVTDILSDVLRIKVILCWTI